MSTKVPRFAFEKVPRANDRLTTQMKSVGEVMAIGRTFQESLQKALRGLEVGVYGLDEIEADKDIIDRELANPGAERLWYLGQAFRNGMDLDRAFQLTKIDPWFLVQIQDIVREEAALGGVVAVMTLRSRLAGIAAGVRGARATTPGVNVGVGFLDCWGATNGVANGIDGRAADVCSAGSPAAMTSSRSEAKSFVVNVPMPASSPCPELTREPSFRCKAYRCAVNKVTQKSGGMA